MLKSIIFGHFGLAFIFQVWNCLVGFTKQYYLYFIFGKYPDIVRTLLFCVIMQREVVISYEHFGTTYRSNFHVSGIQNVFLS